MTVAESQLDLYSDTTLSGTQGVYKELRDTGPIVFCSNNDLYAITQYDAVRDALRSDSILINGKGVAANDLINNTPSETVIISDGETHARRRNILMKPLNMRAISDVRDRIQETADRCVEELVERDRFCGVKDFASVLPISIVADMVGLTEHGRENMLDWAAATFNALGPANDRTMAALPLAGQLLQYTATLSADQVSPEGWAGQILSHAEQGSISPSEAVMMIVDYVAPSLDTTILASAHMLWQLGKTPRAFEALRSNEQLVPGIVNETVRLSSPIRSFTRFAQSDYNSEYGRIPAGARAVILYASANWDERHYQNAHSFVVERNPRDHVGWGHGVHSCAGMHLARAEMEALARSLARYATSIEVDAPIPIVNNVLQGFESFNASLN